MVLFNLIFSLPTAGRKIYEDAAQENAKRQRLTEPSFGLTSGVGRPRGHPLLANAGMGLRGELGIEGAESGRTNVIDGGRVLPETPAPRPGTGRSGQIRDVS